MNIISPHSSKEKHLIKLDIDGTSTNADFSTLNPKLKTVLQKLKEQGQIICFTTGRNYASALPFYKEVGLDTFLATYNGAFINNPSDKDNKEIVVFHSIKNNLVKDILNEPVIKENILNVLIDHVNGLKANGEIDLKTISTSDDIYYREIFFNNNPYTLAEEEKIVDEITSSHFESRDSYSIKTKNNKEVFYYDLNKYEKREVREARIQKIEEDRKLGKQNKYVFFITHKNQESKAISPQIIKMKEIEEHDKGREELSALNLLKCLGKKDVLQLVLEFPKDEKIFNEILLILRRKYSDAITFYFGSKLKAKTPGDKILVPDPERKIIKIRNGLASKGMGAKWVAKQHNISLHNVIAFGNDVNDIELVHSVGKGIVTADSNDYLKTYAYGITDFGLLNSDGVAKFLTDYFSLERKNI